jgi:uncharacterized phage protein (TIGR01671 family)
MSREIKFRGKRIDNGGWSYGDLIHNFAITPIGTRDKVHVGKYEVIPETVGEFAGLRDRQNKEIYEGDIVASMLDDEISSFGDIQFYHGVFGVEWMQHKKDRTYVGSWGQRHNLRRLDDDLIDNIKVIGNVHDNPAMCYKEKKQ